MKKTLFTLILALLSVCAMAQSVVWERPAATYSPVLDIVKPIRVELSSEKTAVTFRFQNSAGRESRPPRPQQSGECGERIDGRVIYERDFSNNIIRYKL